MDCASKLNVRYVNFFGKTFDLFFPSNYKFHLQGKIKCEFPDEEGALLEIFYGPGYMLAACSVFLNQASLRTYSASTDCEVSISFITGLLTNADQPRHNQCVEVVSSSCSL